MKQYFKKNSKSLFASLAISLALFSSCQNSSPLEESNVQKFEFEAASEFEFPTIDESDILADEFENSTRALNMKFINSKTGKTHPGIELSYTKGNQVPIVAIIKNATSGTTIIKEMQWTFNDDGKTLSITGKTGGDFTDATTIGANNSKDWKLFLIMGGNYNDATKKLSFQGYSSNLSVKKNPGEKFVLDAIYMTDGAWTPLEFSLDKGVAKFRAKSKIKLKNIGTTFAVTARSIQGRHFIDNFYPAVSNYSFAGTFDLSSSNIDEAIPFEPIPGSSSANIKTNKNVTIIANGAYLNGYFPIWGVPLDNLESTIGGYLRVSDHATQSTTRPFSRQATLETNRIYGFEIPIMQPAGKTHPIEQFYADPSGFIIPYFRNNKDVDIAIDNAEVGRTIERTTKFHIYNYNVAEELEYRIIAPGTNGGNDLHHRVSGERAYVLIGDRGARSFGQFQEQVKAFGAIDTYTSHVRNTYSNVSYATRFAGGAGGKYYSAYRYEKLPNKDVKITVRVLGPQNITIGIDQISNEDWWRTNPKKLKEIIRYVRRGIWFSSTSGASRSRPNIRPILGVFPVDGNKDDIDNDGIYTSAWMTWGYFKGLAQNDNYGALLVAEEKGGN